MAKTKYHPGCDTLRIQALWQNYRYRNLISQIFRDGKIYIDVGVICISEVQRKDRVIADPASSIER
jgi:hypothetical protein